MHSFFLKEKIMNENYDKIMMKEIGVLTEYGLVRPRLLLHSCCGPCSTAVIERLNEHFDLTVFFYNPNIDERAEYEHRKAEQIRFINEKYPSGEVKFLEGPYDTESFLAFAEGLKTEPEGGSRCALCFDLRLRTTAEEAVNNNFSIFATTLTVSPMKNAEMINELGLKIGEETGVKYLVGDFKKRAGYQRSIEISKEYNLYRQHFCGCSFGAANQEC